MLYGPIENAMAVIGKENDINQKVWRAVHEISHMFLEGGEVMLNIGALS